MSLAFSSLPPVQQDEILNGPALAPPAGVVPNFLNPPNLNVVGYAITSLCLVLSTICVMTRLYTKCILIKRMRIEDYLLVVGYGIYLGIVYCIYRLCADVGLQVHQWNFHLKDLSSYLYILHITTNLYTVQAMVSKTAILFDWIHIFIPTGTRDCFFWLFHIQILIVIFSYTATVFFDNLICSPIQVLWDPFAEGSCFRRLSCGPLEALWNPLVNASCWDPRTILHFVTSIVNLTTNVFILLLPQKIIWKLHMPTKKKVGVSVVFTMGILALVSSALRIASAMQLRTQDITYVSGMLVLSSLAEMTCSFIVLCAPVAPRAWKSLKTIGDSSIMKPWTWTRSTLATDQREPPWASIRKALRKGPDYRKIGVNNPHAKNGGPSWPADQDGIMRTNEITSTFEDRSDSMVADQFGRIHPWVIER